LFDLSPETNSDGLNFSGRTPGKILINWKDSTEFDYSVNNRMFNYAHVRECKRDLENCRVCDQTGPCTECEYWYSLEEEVCKVSEWTKFYLRSPMLDYNTNSSNDL